MHSLTSSIRAWMQAGCSLICLPTALVAEQILFDTAQEWRQWQIPFGAVELGEDGIIRPVLVRKDINAALNAQRLGGGILAAGSNPQDAPMVLDGDPTSGWGPDPADPPESWYIEIDLGRAISAYRVNLIFDERGPPFEIIDLLLSTGEPQRDNTLGGIPGTLVYRIKERFKENRRHKLSFELDQSDHTPIQFLRIASLKHVPEARLVEVEVEAIGDNIAPGLQERGGAVEIRTDLSKPDEQVALGNALALVDGYLATRWRTRIPKRAPDDVNAHIVLDLGAVYWVDMVRLISQVTVRPLGLNRFSRRLFAYNFYQVMTSDGSLAPDGTRKWIMHFSGRGTPADNNRGMVDHPFGLTPARYVRIFWKFWDTNCSSGLEAGSFASLRTGQKGCDALGTAEEIQVFGKGYPRRTDLRSSLIDLGEDKNLNRIEWRASTPPSTRVEIRSRTGNEVAARYSFHDKNGKEVTEKRYDKLIPSFRGRIDTAVAATGNWSPWSKIYSFSGESFQSPSPRRYLELGVRLVSNIPQRAATLDFLALHFSDPVASHVVGEIAPVEVSPGVATEFSYFLRSPQVRSEGFDYLALETSAPVEFQTAFIDGERVAAESEQTPAGFRVAFPRPVRSNQLVELRFESAIFLQSTRFDVFLEGGRQANSVRQRVDPGDATDGVESSTNVVRLPVSQNLLANLSITPPVLTPNGDGRNDAIRITLDLVNILVPRSLHLRLFDLSGRLLHSEEKQVVAGRQELIWTGQGSAGAQVPPGLYLLRVHVDGDAREETAQRLVAVVY